MKHIKTQDELNESWRQIKPYLSLPKILIEKLFGALTKFVPLLNLRYDELAAKIDLGKSLTPYKIKEEPKELSIKDIKNVALKNSLIITGLFNKWKIYFIRISPDISSGIKQDKTVLYISKDEINLGDTYYGERITIDEKEQMYIMVAIKSNEHIEMGKERDERFKNKANKELEAAVDKAIKKNTYKRSNSFTNEWNNDPILFKVVRADRLDLFNKIINYVSSDFAKHLVTMKINPDGWEDHYGKPLKDDAKSEKMKNAIESVIYTPEELEEMRLKKDTEKYNL